MTNREYLEEMFELTVRLTDAVNNFGFRSAEYNAVLKDIAVSALKFNCNRRRRRRSWSAIVFIVILILIIAWLLYECLSFVFDISGPSL